MAKHLSLGKRGEALAEQYLIQRGYRIAERNWRHGHLEIDLIAWLGKLLVIIEVKTLQTDAWGKPEEGVDEHKEKLLISATEAYLFEKKLDCESRFDIISIVMGGTHPQINHIEDAFFPE